MRISIMAVALITIMAMRVEAAEEASMEQTIRNFYQDVFNGHDVGAVDRYVSEDFVDHNPDPGQQPGREGVKDAFRQMFAAFPDIHVTTEQVLVSGNFVTVRSTLAGTQDGDFMGTPASHRSFRITLIDIIEMIDGKATQRWGLLDSATMLEQLTPEIEKTEP